MGIYFSNDRGRLRNFILLKGDGTINNFKLIDEVNNVLKTLNNKGFYSFLVGGAIRDQILGYDVLDYDITTNANFDEIENLFKEYKPKLYSSKKCMLIRINKINIEISPFKAPTIDEDLKLRDYTVNSIAYSLNGFYDPLNGLDDLQNKKLKLVNDPKIVFEGDPLRILRGIRLHATKGITPDKDLIDILNNYAYLLDKVHPMRIRGEIDQIIVVDKPSIYLDLYKDVIKTLYKEFDKCIGFDQRSDWHIYDVYTHILKVVDSVSNDLITRLAALFHDIKKPECFKLGEDNKGHFPHHDIESANYAKEILTYYSYPAYIINAVYKIIFYHDYRLSMDRLNDLKFLVMFGTKDLNKFFELQMADMKAQNPKLIDRLPNYIDIVKYVISITKEERYINISDLRISSKDFIKLGFTDEKLNIRRLRRMTIDVIEGKLENDRDLLIYKMRDYIYN